MANLKFGSFEFPINPESCRLSFHRDYKVTVNDSGKWISTQGTRLARRMECRGNFCGVSAHSNFNTLASLFINGASHALLHQKWDPFVAFIAELEVLEEPQENLLQYRILFVELPST